MKTNYTLVVKLVVAAKLQLSVLFNLNMDNVFHEAIFRQHNI